MAFALGSFAVVERLGRGVAQGGEGGEEHGVLEPVVPSRARVSPVQGGAGLAGDGGQAGVGGELAAVGEGGAVADLGEDAGAGPRADPWHGGQQLTERVGQECLLDLGGQGVAAAADAVELGGQLGDHPAGGGLGRDGDVLGGQGRGRRRR